jgi:hypothetical protein
MSLASIPGNSAEILYAFSSSLISIAGVEKLNELRHAGSISNIRRSDGKPNPAPKRSNSRSISLRKDCHISGTVVCAGGAFFTSTGTSAIAVSIGQWKGNASILAKSIGGTLIERNSSRRCIPSPSSHRPAHPLGGERYRRRAWQCAGARDFVEYGFGVGADFFGDQREGGRLGSTAIFDRCADHAAGIGDEIGQDEHAASGERALGLHRARDVGAVGDEPGLQPRDVVGVDDIRPCRRDSGIARDVDDRLHAKLAAARMIVQCPPFGL